MQSKAIEDITSCGVVVSSSGGVGHSPAAFAPIHRMRRDRAACSRRCAGTRRRVGAEVGQRRMPTRKTNLSVETRARSVVTAKHCARRHRSRPDSTAHELLRRDVAKCGQAPCRTRKRVNYLQCAEWLRPTEFAGIVLLHTPSSRDKIPHIGGGAAGSSNTETCCGACMRAAERVRFLPGASQPATALG